MRPQYANLQEAIADNVFLGSSVARMGRAKIPEGYAILLNPDRTHFYWINVAGEEGAIDWDKWSVLRGAKARAGVK